MKYIALAITILTFYAGATSIATIIISDEIVRFQDVLFISILFVMGAFNLLLFFKEEKVREFLDKWMDER